MCIDIHIQKLFQSTIDIHIQITHKNAKPARKTPNFDRIAGARGGGVEGEVLLLQSIIDIHIQIKHKNAKTARKRLILIGSLGLAAKMKVKCRKNTIDPI